MAFPLLLIYIVFSYVYPAEIFPWLGEYRITYAVGLMGLATAAVSLLFRNAPLKMLQLWIALAFTMVLGLSLAYAERRYGAPLSALQRFGPSLTMFVLTVCSIDSMRKLRIALTTVAFLALIVLAQGAAAYYLGINSEMFVFNPATRAEYVAAVDGQSEYEADQTDIDYSEGDTTLRIRGLGMLHDPNDLALAFVMVLPLLGMAWRPRAPVHNSLFAILPAAALTYGVFLTRSRGGTLALLLTLWGAAVTRFGRTKSVFALGLLIALIGAADFTGGRSIMAASDSSALGRVQAWSEGIQMLKSQPILGVGYTQFLDHHQLTAHNSFVLCFAETGLVGYFFWLGLLTVTLIQLSDLKRAAAHAPDQPDAGKLARLASILQLSIVAYMAAGFFLSRTYAPTLYLILGFAVALIFIGRQSNLVLRSRSIVQLAAIVVTCEIGSILVMYALVRLQLT